MKLFLITYALLVWFRDELVLNGLAANSGLVKEFMSIDGSPKKSYEEPIAQDPLHIPSTQGR
jgi:hypothetical protein